MPERRSLKVVLIGDGGAGKTSVRHSFLSGGAFASSYKATIGADFITRTLPLSPSCPNGPRVTLSIWDTAGQERFQALGAAFYRGADAVIIMFDASKGRAELERVQFWKEEFAKRTPVRSGGESRRFAWLCVGNKADLLGTNAAAPGVSEEEARSFLEELLPRKPGPRGSKMPGSGAQEPAKPRDVLARPEPNEDSHQQELSSSQSNSVNPTYSEQPSISSLHNRSASHDRTVPNLRVPGTEGAPSSRILRSRLSLRSIDVYNVDNLKRQSSLRGSGKRQMSNAAASSSSTSSPAPSTPEQTSGDALGRRRVDSTISQISLLSHGASVYHTPRTSTYFAPSTSPSQSTRDVSPSRGSSRTIHGRTIKRSDASADSEAATSAHGSVATPNCSARRDRSTSPVPSERSTTFTVTGDDVVTPTAGLASSNGTLKLAISAGDDKVGADADDQDFETVAPANAFLSGDPIPFPSTEEDEDLEEEQILTTDANRFEPSPLASESGGDSAAGGRGWLDALKIKDRDGGSSASKRNGNGSGVDERRQSLVDADRYGTLKTIPPEEVVDETDGIQPPASLPPPGKAFASRKNSIHQGTAPPATVAGPTDLLADDPPDMEEGFTLFYTSAKTGNNIGALFEHVVARVRTRWELEEWEERERGRERTAAALGVPYSFGGRRAGGGTRGGSIRLPRDSIEGMFAPPSADRERHEEQVRRGIRIAAGKDPDPGKGGWRSCCS